MDTQHKREKKTEMANSTKHPPPTSNSVPRQKILLVWSIIPRVNEDGKQLVVADPIWAVISLL